MAAEEMVRRTNQMGVPVIAVGDEHVIGFDRQRLEELLAARGGPGTGPGGAKAPPRVSFGLKIADASRVSRKAGAVPLFGAFVGSVRPGSLAESAGLQQGDIITEVNLRPISTADDLARVLAGLAPGHRLTVGFLRGEHRMQTEAVV